jgi:hypothetical protein
MDLKLYGTELGSVTLKRVGLFCSPTKHATHTPEIVQDTDMLGVFLEPHPV